jgi:biotin carboxyl carrier protein
MRRELVATFSGGDVSIEVELGADGRFSVSQGGERRVVDAVEIRPGTWSLLVDGRSLVVDLDRRKQGVAILVRGSETLVALEDARRRRLAQAQRGARHASGGETVRAPIAGKVVKYLVALGDQVTPGQGVAVLEAMKMENEICADRGGKVARLHAQPGDSVEPDAALLTLG